MNSTARPQQTIRHDIRFSGIALHEGGIVNVRLAPAEENTGIVFRRTDKNTAIRAHCQSVSDTRLATTLSDGNGTSVSTVEHLLSALAALAVDNLYIDLDGGELPIVDGSAAPWFVYLNACGLSRQKAARRTIRVIQSVGVGAAGGRQAGWQPSATKGTSRYDVSIDFPHAVVNRSGRHQCFTLNKDGYERDISRARTFCYVNDVEAMHRLNRARGGSLQNAVVYDDEGVINQEGLRYPNEFVRHKILDVIGDCYINGHLVIGDYVGKSPGHDINNQLMRALLDTPNAWEWSEDEA